MLSTEIAVVWTLLIALSPSAPVQAVSPDLLLPFERTEVREPCANYEPTKQPFFGETHLHTAYSFDSVALDTRNTPADAYRYAKGGRVGLPPWADTRTDEQAALPPPPDMRSYVTEHPYCMPGEHCQFMATRTIQFPEGRALDFAAVTDHSEQFGESNICTFEATETCSDDQDCNPGVTGQGCASDNMCRPKGYNSPLCVIARDELSRLRQGTAASVFAALENVSQNPTRPAFCGPDGALCARQAKLVWDKIRGDAEAAYDRTSSCTFTSFIAYEYTAMAATGRCVDANALPCWDQAQDNSIPDVPDAGWSPSADCPSGSPCINNFTGNSGFDNLHRNIIFRNDDVIDQPISNLESPLGCGFGADCTSTPGWAVASPAVMLQRLNDDCIANPAKPRCDVLTIPHNSNMSRGSMFILPENTPDGQAEAYLRNQLEPLVELVQIKGQSECRYNANTGMAWTNPPDELCDFENQGWARLAGAADGYLTDENQTTESIPPRSYVRNTLASGIAYAAKQGVNPFQLGFVGGLDNHNGTPGQSEEQQYAKSGAHGIQSFATSSAALSERFYLGLETNAGGLTVAWAEENSRDAIFTALKNRETYATSGTRPIVRVFGGFGLPSDICEAGDFAARGYAGGVPMGGTLQREPRPPGRVPQAPSFAVSAIMDPGWSGHPGTPLQRAQIIKGWVDSIGQTHERVYDVAGTTDAEDKVDLQTCKPIGAGMNNLCTLWTDPDFDPDQHAFYYVRVLENPSCRWNHYYCNARGVDCSKPMGVCRGQATEGLEQGCDSDAECGEGVCTLPDSYEEFEYSQCCSGIVPQTVQQRAWTSPIWYTP
ncbi:DUF3604 domain-containing protein [Thiorhodovibrio litoralis]|uniref:DUF3604 domain-containing protein n=1 Tax=Thiorhodovibrio litoralis TaxID=2952932 RepID=UPI002B25E6F5|nr:DUF3604 domain-containing protein [Thiorhodovibrio litoralis]